MSQVVRSLEVITAEAKIIYNRIDWADFRRFGELMVEAKEQLPHGQFLKYLEENFPMIGHRQAQRYMELARDTTKILRLEDVRKDRNVIVIQNQGSNTTQGRIQREPKLETIERAIHKQAVERMKEWRHRSRVMEMHIKEFLTTVEPVGRDLWEAIDNIDKFEFNEDVDRLFNIQTELDILSKRADLLSDKLRSVLLNWRRKA